MKTVLIQIFMKSFNTTIDSPFGNIVISASDIGVTGVKMIQSSQSDNNRNEWSNKGAEQLRQYFAKERTSFDLVYDFNGYTDFYKSVWNKLLSIPYGQTCSYLDIAKVLNNPKSVRAVGMANGKNPVGIIIPCHRVIGTDGSLIGYAQGLEMKRWLLEFEGAIQPEIQMSLF